MQHQPRKVNVISYVGSWLNSWVGSFNHAGDRPLQRLRVHRGLLLGRHCAIAECAPPLCVRHREMRRKAVALREGALGGTPPHAARQEDSGMEVLRAWGRNGTHKHGNVNAATVKCSKCGHHDTTRENSMWRDKVRV
jgi:hypothetical protein